MAELRIADDLALPLEATTQAVAILAKRGAGKTYTAGVWAEEMLGAGLQVVILDPMGAWYGLRSSADGKGPGFPIAILGGEHADVPLEATGGHMVADLAVDDRLSMVVDQSAFSKNERRRFVTDFLERLYHRNRDAMHVILEEADLVAPQRYGQGEERMLGAVFDLVRRGRGRGLGSTLITQRSATLNNEVLEQADILVTLRTTGPADRKAIDRWVDTHDDLSARKDVRDSLPSLPTGTAWVWWPEQELLKRVAIRVKTTFDSSATPKPGEIRRAPKTVADVDISALSVRMVATIEKAKADDPRELRRRIAHLEAEVKASHGVIARRPEPEVVEKIVEVPVLNGQVEHLQAVAVTLGHVGQEIARVGADIVAAIGRVQAPESPRTARAAPVAYTPTPRPAAPARPAAPPPAPASDGPVSLDRAQRALLTALAQFPDGLTKVRLSLVSGYSIKSSSFANALGALRSAGLVDKVGEPIRATEEGRAAVPDAPPPPTPDETLGYWLGRVDKAQRAILAAIVEAHPDELSKAELSERSGYSLTSSSFANAIGALRSLGLVERGSLRATEGLGL